jgi:hypothetical protein
VPNAPRTLPQCPAGCGSTPCGGHPRLDSRPRPGCAAAVDAACGACVHCRGRRGMHGRSAAGDRHVPALLRGAAAVSAADGGRPASTWPAIPDVQRALPRCPVPRTPLGSGPGRRGRRTSAVQMCDRGRGLRTPATRRRPARWTPATAARARGHCGMGTRTPRQRPAGQPAAEPSTAAWMSGRERDRKVRRLVLYVGLVGSSRIWSSRIWPAHVGCLVDPDGSRRVPSDRLDDQPDDQARQAARRAESGWSTRFGVCCSIHKEWRGVEVSLTALDRYPERMTVPA